MSVLTTRATVSNSVKARSLFERYSGCGPDPGCETDVTKCIDSNGYPAKGRNPCACLKNCGPHGVGCDYGCY